MASLQVRGADLSVPKQKAIEDAKRMQKAVVETCNKSGKDVPQYQLTELIGKGSFGRVYKSIRLSTKQLVAVKIIDIEESDTVDPKLSDTYSDLLKEINALQLLGESGARNVNHVIEALPVGQAMWVITEYCAGGSVSTLMKPTAPGGLQEKWIIPILREVAEALSWVHGAGIIHRDVKCANVLVTEVGDVQLCDFGVAGVMETKADKRTTVIGTPHWMAPELFDNTASYGTEVDIWAYGAMVYEIATGLPPNAVPGFDFSRLGNHLKHHTPRLEGDQYSHGLKDIISFCLQHEPSQRPAIQQIQRHKYIFKTEEAYPAASLAQLVRGFKLWEAQGGDRRSLFSAGGAQAPPEFSSTAMANDEWNFSTTAAFDQQVFDNGDAQDVYDVYGSAVDLGEAGFEDTARQPKPKARRRPPPQLPSVKAPLEKIFDPNTMSNYEDNSRAYYGRQFPPPTTASDLPLRDDSAPSAAVRESLIDLDASLDGSELSSFTDMNTMRPSDHRFGADYDNDGLSYDDGAHFNDAPLSDPVDMSNRHTRDWKFPTMPQVSTGSDVFKFPAIEEGTSQEAASRPPLLHHPTEPIQPSATFNDLATAKADSFDSRASMGSLIDLDMSFDIAPSDYTRPSTSHSDVGSITGSEIGGANPFELEKHASLYVPSGTIREPSIYVSSDSEFHTVVSNGPDWVDQAPLRTTAPTEPRPYSLSEFADMDPEMMPEQPPPTLEMPILPQAGHHPQPSLNGSADLPLHSDRGDLPALPLAPSPMVLLGQTSSEDVKEDLRRLAMSLGDHLSFASDFLSALPVRRGSMPRMETPVEGPA